MLPPGYEASLGGIAVRRRRGLETLHVGDDDQPHRGDDDRRRLDNHRPVQLDYYRRKLGTWATHIETVRGIGYRMG